MKFGSDNWAGAAPEILDALAREAATFGGSYGESDLDKRVVAQFSELFERDVAVLFVGTGSAANGLALASVAKPGGVVFCHQGSHVITDECGGVEHMAAVRLIGVEGKIGKIDPGALTDAIGRFEPGLRAVHHGQPVAVSITQQNEAGGIYSLAEIGSIVSVACERNLPVHMDGSRFGNAVARLGVSPAEMTWKAGVDLLSFGGTKNGCLIAEALVIFDPAKAREAHFLRKRAGHLFSKARFIAAQFEAYLRDGLWLKLAGNANAMADRLRSGLRALSHAREAWPTEGNEVFLVLRSGDAKRLRQAGAVFFDWPQIYGVEADVAPEETIVRLVMSFSTEADEVDRFLDVLASRSSLSGERSKVRESSI